MENIKAGWRILNLGGEFQARWRLLMWVENFKLINECRI